MNEPVLTYHETAEINWRLLHTYLKKPVQYELCPGIKQQRPLSIMLSKTELSDALQIRDWLHDPETVNGRYKFHAIFTQWSIGLGCAGKLNFVGASFVFRQKTDAVYFRLMWGGTVD